MGTNGRFSHHINYCEINTSKAGLFQRKFTLSLSQNYATCGHNIIFSFDVTVIQWNISCQKGSAEAQW